MRTLGEQWIELGADGKEHMYKAFGNNAEKQFDCSGCVFNGNRGQCCYKNQDCPVGMCANAVIKDLGILKDGVLPAPWDKSVYPGIFKISDNRWIVQASSGDGLTMSAMGETEQEAKDAWNRRS
jgi:hypothetical protein